MHEIFFENLRNPACSRRAGLMRQFRPNQVYSTSCSGHVGLGMGLGDSKNDLPVYTMVNLVLQLCTQLCTRSTRVLYRTEL